MDEPTPRPPKMGFEHVSEQEQLKLGDSLWEVHAAGMKIVEYTQGRDFEEFAASDLLRTLAETMLAIMAAALSTIEHAFPGQFAKLPVAPRLIQAADRAPGSSAETLWRTVEETVPEVVAQARALLEEWHQA